jgi:hypothetical protein
MLSLLAKNHVIIKYHVFFADTFSDYTTCDTIMLLNVTFCDDTFSNGPE